MGNTLNVASVNAADLIYPITEQTPQHHKVHERRNFNDEIPPECPMHKEQQPKKNVSECPMNHGKDSDINPLNMVRIELKRREFLFILCNGNFVLLYCEIVDASCKPTTCTRSAVSSAY